METFRKQSYQNQMHVLLVLSTYNTSAEIFILKPLAPLVKAGKITLEKVLENELSRAKLMGADVVLYCRNNLPEARHWYEEIIALRIPIIYVLDDNFWALPYYLEDGAYYKTGGRLQQVEEYIRYADLVKVFSPALYRRVRQYTPNVICSTPGMDFNLLPKELPARKDEIIRIAYVTARGPKDELVQLFEKDLLRLLREFPHRIQAVFFGSCPSSFRDVSNVEEVDINWNYANFVRELALRRYDIGLAPLLNTEFYLSKTNTKVRDYGACRMAGVYSDLEPYVDIVDGKTGLLVQQQPDAWYDAMRKLVLDDDLRISIQEQAYQYVYDNYRQEICEQEWLAQIERFAAYRRKSITYSPLAGKNPQQVRVALGAAQQLATQGFIDVDDHIRPGIQILADWNATLPFAANSFEILWVHHVLDKVVDQQALMREIHRVTKPGAQVCAVSTYTSPAEVAAGKTFRAINEQTAREWTSAPGSGVYPDEVSVFVRDGQPWGLGKGMDIDLRCVDIRFLYRAGYRGLPNQEKRAARHEMGEVCDTVMMQLITVKAGEPEPDLSFVKERLFEPLAVKIDWLQETIASQNYERANLAVILSEQTKQMEQLQVKSRALASDLDDTKAKLAFTRERANSAADDLDVLRNRRIFLMIERLFDRSNIKDAMTSAYHQMQDDSLLFNYSLDGYLLQISPNLRHIPFCEYNLGWQGKRILEGVYLAPVIDVPLTGGRIGVEFVSSGNILGQASILVEAITGREPVLIPFTPPIELPKGEIIVRVFARDIDVPLRIVEWRKYQQFGVKVQRKLFCGFRFSER